MVPAKMRASPGRTPNAEATGAGAVGQAQSWRRRGPAASRARTRVAAADGSEVKEGIGGRGKRRGRRAAAELTVVAGTEAPVEVDAPVHGGRRWDPLHRRHSRRRLQMGMHE